MSENDSDNQKPKPVDLDKIDLDLMKLKTADLPALMEYAHSVGGFSIVPTEQGIIKSHSRTAMVEQTDEQLSLIYEQMKTLARQVQEIKKRVYVSDLIYNADIPFVPVIGKIYFLYENQHGKRFLSLISPEEWKEKISDKIFIAEIRLNADHTWKVIRSTIELS